MFHFLIIIIIIRNMYTRTENKATFYLLNFYTFHIHNNNNINESVTIKINFSLYQILSK